VRLLGLAETIGCVKPLSKDLLLPLIDDLFVIKPPIFDLVEFKGTIFEFVRFNFNLSFFGASLIKGCYRILATTIF
jgi:hypothetical protein